MKTGSRSAAKTTLERSDDDPKGEMTRRVRRSRINESAERWGDNVGV